jgi:hypothetical protein
MLILDICFGLKGIKVMKLNQLLLVIFFCELHNTSETLTTYAHSSL